MADEYKWWEDPDLVGSTASTEAPEIPESSLSSTDSFSSADSNDWWTDPDIVGGGDDGEMPEPEDNTGASILDSTIAQWGHASGTLAKHMGEGLREWLGADSAARFFEDIGESAERYWSGSLEPGEWEALQKKASKEFLKLSDENKSAFNPTNWELGDANLESLWYKLVGSGPAMTAGMAGGMGVAGATLKGLDKLNKFQKLKNTIKVGRAAEISGGSAQAIKAGKSAERMMKFIQGGSAAVGYGATEGGISALASGSEAKARVMEMPFEKLLTDNEYATNVYEAAIEEGMQPEEAADHTRDYISDLVYKETSARTFLTTGAAGAVAGWALGPIIARTPFGPEFAKGFLRGGVKGATAEASQEAVQSGYEQYWQNVALKKYADSSIQEADGVFSAVVDGVVTGAAFGGPIGAVEGMSNRRQSMVDDQERNQENTALFEMHLKMADSALGERGWAEQDRIGVFEPIAQELADTGNIVKAISSLRSLEKTGELRQLGAPQPEGMDVPMAPQYRAGEERNGIVLTADYGEFPGTVGADGDPIDFYHGKTGENNYVIEKRNEDGTFQQHKVMVGYETEDEAIAAFYENSDPAHDSFMSATEMDQAGLRDFLELTTARYQELKQEAPDLTGVPDEFLEAAMESGEDIPFESLSAEQKAVFNKAGVVESVTVEEEGAIPYDVIPSRTLATEFERRKAIKGPSEGEKAVQKAVSEAITQDDDEDGKPPPAAAGVLVEKEADEEPPLSLVSRETPLRNPKNIRSLMAHVTPKAADFESKLTEEQQDQALKAVGLKPEEFTRASQKHHALRLWAQADRIHAKATKKEVTKTKVGDNPAVTARYVHQSIKPDLSRLKKAMYRTGASQSPQSGERKWVDNLPEDQQNRVFFNVVRDQDPKSGEQLAKAKHLYTGKADKLYDMHADPLRLSAMTMPEIEAKLRDMGYNGIMQTDSRGMFGWTWVDLATAYQGTSRGLQGKKLLQEPSMQRNLVAFETIHGRVSPIYKAMQKLAPDERAAYHTSVLGALFDSDFREDKLAKVLGAAGRLLQTGQGAWEGGLSPNAAVELNSDAEADFYANAVRFIFQQDSAGWMALDDNGQDDAVAIEKPEGWSESDLQAFAEALPEEIKGFTQVGDTVFISNYTEMDTDGFVDAVQGALGAVENATIYRQQLRSNWYDESKGKPEELLESSAIAQGSPRKIQWVHDAARTAQRLTRKYFEGLPKDHQARKEYEKLKGNWPDISRLDLRRRENWSESRLEQARQKMKEQNLRAAYEKDYLQALVDRVDWSTLNEKVDAAAAGAYTREEVQEAITEWTLKGVASKYFKRWFGKSKIVDADGVPIPMFHSTTAEMIKEFQSGRRGFMSFSEDPEFANWHQLRRMGNKPKPFNIVPAFIKAEKVFDYRNRAMRRSLVRFLKKEGTEQEVVNLIREQMMGAEMVTEGTRKAARKDLASTLGLSGMIASGSWAVYESPVVMKVLRERGYDAFWMTSLDGKVTNLGVFDTANIKSAVGNLGTFDQSIQDTVYSLRAPNTQEVFQSAIAQWVDTKMGKRMPVEQAIKAFTNLSGKDIKKDEVDDIGLVPYLMELGKGQKMVTRNELLQFVRDKQIQFREIEVRPTSMGIGIPLPNESQRTHLTPDAAEANIGRIKDELSEELADLNYSPTEIESILAEYERNGTSALDDYLGALSVNHFHRSMNDAKLDLWQARLKESQRNRMVAEPSDDQIRTGGLKYSEYTSFYEAGYQMYDNPTYREFVITIPMQDGQTDPFKTHHWEDDNVIVHMRAWTHVDSSTGESSLFVEEVQSDWHQQGSRYGYNTGLDGSPPNGPLQHTWANLGMRRLIRYAAENGHHRVMWASGDMQRKRYDLMGMGVSHIAVTKEANDTFQVEFKIHGERHSSSGLSQRDLDKAIGAEIADRITKKMDQQGSDRAELSGEEVRWTGAAVKKFYDSNSKTGLRYLTDKYIKRYGSKVQVYENVKVLGNYVDVWGFEVTDKLREKAMAGQSPYSLTDNVASEMMRRLELYQLRAYLEKSTKSSSTNRAIRARLMDGAERGFYSKWIVHHSGVMIGKLDRSAMIRRIAERIASGDMVTQRNAIAPNIIENELRHIVSTWENPPQFEVHRDYTTLPPRLRNKVITHGYQWRIEGTIDPLAGGKVHIVASNIGSIERLHRVFTEEALGHFGLRKVFGEEFRPFLKGVLPSVEGSKAWNNLLEEYPHLKRTIESGTQKNAMRAKLLATEELIAKQEVDQTVWQKFVAWFREWLRKHNLITTYTENDIKHVMAKVHAHVMNGDTPHAWGERNFNGAVYRDHGMVYSLYGDILKSRLENRLTDAKFQKKAPPAQYLQMLKNPQKFPQQELAYSGIIPWLESQQINDPKTAVTSQQLLDVFHKNKPRYQVISRSGKYLFPSLPLSQLVRVGASDVRNDVDMAKVDSDANMFGDLLREYMDKADADPRSEEWQVLTDRLRRNLTDSFMEGFNAGTLTPRLLYQHEFLSSPLGDWVDDNNIPDYRALADDPERLSVVLGVNDADAPITYENSNAHIKAFMSGVLKQALQNNDMAYRRKQVFMHIELERYGPLGNVGVQYTTNRDGEIDAIVGLEGNRRFKTLDAPDLVDGMNQLVDEYHKDLKEWAAFDMPAGFVKPKQPDLSDRLIERVQAYIETKIEEVTDRRDFMDMPSEEIIPAIPEAGETIKELMSSGNSGSGIMEYHNPDAELSRSVYDSTQYDEYTFEGAVESSYGVITIEMLDPPLGATDIPSSSAHFSRGVYNILHARMQTRMVDGLKVLSLEEVQSDWASAYNASEPLQKEQTEWENKNWRLIGKVAKVANEQLDYATYRSGNRNIFEMLTLFEENTALLEDQPLDFQSGIRSSYDSIAKSAMTSNTFISLLSKVDSQLANEWKKAVKTEARDMQKTKTEMPWVRSYPELALRAVTKWAIANGYDAVAWPEGGEVAQLYSGWEQIAGKHNGLVIDLKTQNVKGVKIAEQDQNDFTEVSQSADLDTFINNSFDNDAAMRDSGVPYDLDYLTEIIEEGGANAELAKGLAGYVKAYLSRDREGDWENALESNIYHAEGDRIFVRLPEERLYNARLHKLLYNRLLVNAARDIAGYNKKGKWTRDGKEPVGRMFIEEAYSYKKWGSRRKRSDDVRRGQWLEGDYWDGSIFRLLSEEMRDKVSDDPEGADFREIGIARQQQLHGRDGGQLRGKLAYHLSGYEGELGPRYQNDPRAIRTEYNLTQDGEVFENVSILKLWGWDRARSESSIKVRPVRAAEVMHANKYQTGVFSNSNYMIMQVETENGHVIDIPIKHINTSGNFGTEAGYDFSDVSLDPTASSLYYRMVYQLMQSWGIANPAPTRVPSTLLKDLYMDVYSNLDAMSSGDADVSSRTRDAYSEMLDGAWKKSHSSTWDNSEPSDHELSWADFKINNRTGEPVADEDALSGADWMTVRQFGRPSPKLLEWLRANASMEEKTDGAHALAFLLENQDSSERDRIMAMMSPDMLGDSLKPPTHIESASMIPVRYYAKNPRETPTLVPIERAEKALADDRAGNVEQKKYGLDNPEFPEQVWHALTLTPEVVESAEDLEFPLSLRRQRGHDRQYSIINNKIAKAHSDMTVLDRVTVWTNTLKEAIISGDMLWGIKQGLLDDAASVERWEREIFGDVQDASISPYKSMHMTKNLPSVMAAIAKAGIPVMRDGAFQPAGNRKGFIDIFRPLYENPDGDLLRLWEGYAAARRSSQLIEQQNKDGTLREKLFSPEEIADLLALGEQYPVFKDVFDDWTKFNDDLLALAVEQGVLSQAEVDAWSTYDYVPFFRAMEEIEGVDQRTGWGKVKAGVAGQQSGIKRLHGSEKMLGNVIENMWFNTASLIDKVYKNHAMSRVVDMLEGIAMTEEEMPWEAVRTTNAQLAAALSRAGLLSKDADTALKQVKGMTSEQRRQWNVIFRRVKPTGPNIVSVMRDGKLRYYQVQDENLLRTLNGMGAEAMGGIMKAMGLSKSLLTRMITIDPAFMLANWMRDTLSAWVTSDANFVPVMDSIASMGDVWKEDGTFIKMMMSGAGGGGFYDLTGGNVSKVIEEQFGGMGGWIPRAWRGYMKLGAMSENSNRLAIANRIEQKGGTASEAMYQAQDIMNFTMSGDWSAVRFLIRTVPFLNARMQGLYRLYRGGRDHPLGFTIKGVALMAASMALLARNWDDEDYDRLEGWQKDMNWNFFVDGVQYAIPKPFEVGLLFGTVPERMMRYLLGKDDLYELKEAGKRAVGETLSFNPIPQLFKPMYELGANVNLFTGNQIESIGLRGMEPPFRYSPWTSPLAIRAGNVMPEWMGIARSPVRIEHAIRAYTGTVGMYTLNSVDWIVRQFDENLPERPARKWYEAPVLSRVIKGESATSRYNRYADRMYRLIDKANEAQGSYNSLLRQGLMEDAEKFADKRANLINPYYKKDSKSLFGGYKSDTSKIDQTPRRAILDVQKRLREVSKTQREIMMHPNMPPDEKRSMLDQSNIERHEILAEAKWLIDELEGGN